MELTLEQSRKLKSTRILLAIGIVSGPTYTIFSDGFSSAIPYINAAIIGLSVALIVAFLEFIVFTSKVKKFRFYKILVLRVFLYTFSITMTVFLVMAISRMFRFNLNFQSVLASAEFKNYLWNEDFLVGTSYALGVVTLVIFTMQMNRKMGQGVLVNIISGRYFKPREVERIMMFIKIQHTKSIIEQIGRLRFHKYLNDIIFDITENILYRKGEIYEYVEDEIVLVWKVNKGIENANCVRTYFEIKDKMEAEKESYYEKYRAVPKFRASLHYGKVIRGEVGDIKSEIKYLGDAMNTASRILGKTTAENDILASSGVIQKLNIPILYKGKSIGKISLRGKTEEIDLHTITESEVKMY